MTAASDASVGHGDAGLQRRTHGDDAVAIRHPVVGQAVDVGDRDLRQEPLDQTVLVRDAGDGFLLHEVADVLVGERLGGVLVVRGGELRERLHVAEAIAVQLGLREAEPGDPGRFGEERGQPFLDAPLRDQGIQGRRLGRAHEEATARLRIQERRIRLLRHLVEARGQQAAEHPLDRLLTIRADGRLIPCGHQAGDADRGGGGLAVGGHRISCARLIGHVVDRPRPRRCRRRDAAEVRPDERLDRRRLEIADRDDRHQIGPVPIGVELLQTVVGERPEDLGLADRQPIRVAGVLEKDGKLRVQHPRARPQAHPPLLEDDPALFLDLLRIERDGLRPVFHDEQRPVDDAGIVGRNLQLVDRLIEARVGVDVRPEAHAHRLQEGDGLLLREVARAVEAHVLDEVGQPSLIVVLENRSRVDDQPELGAALRLLIPADVVAQAVGQRPDGDPRVNGNGRRERYVLGAGRDGALSRRADARRRGDRQGQQNQAGAGAKRLRPARGERLFDSLRSLRVVPSEVEGEKRVFERRSASEWGWGPTSSKKGHADLQMSWNIVTPDRSDNPDLRHEPVPALGYGLDESRR